MTQKNYSGIYWCIYNDGDADFLKQQIADPDINPQGGNIMILGNEEKLVVLDDDVVCHIKYGKINFYHSKTKDMEKYNAWLYRIGGEKYNQACNDLKAIK